MRLAAMAISLAVVTPAVANAAAPETVGKTVRVSYADLDLNQPQAAAVMLKRLDRAAMSACGASPFSAKAVRDDVRSSACYRTALDQAVAQVGAPELVRLHRQ